MRLILLVLLLVMCKISVFAHEPNEAFFSFTSKDSTVIVEAELPWSMRNALIDFNPKLQNASTKSDFENSFREYIKQNLILTGKNGDDFRFLGYQELKNNGHSHQNNYLLKFEGVDLDKVTNTIMFNIHKNQTNFHVIHWNDTKYKTKAKEEINTFKIGKPINFKTKIAVILIIVLLIIMAIPFKKILKGI